MKSIKKAVIPAAGLGTRFFPATKAVPKEMLPIVDRPIILHVIEEAVNAGIEDIVLVQGRGKVAIEDFFDVSYELEDKLIKDGKESLLNSIRTIRAKANIISVRQKVAMGLGHAVYCSKSVIGDSPFAVLLGDEISSLSGVQENTTMALKKFYEETERSVTAVMKVKPENVHKYGVIDFNLDELNRMKVNSLVEKPASDCAPSFWAMPGRYVFSSKFFSCLENQKPGLSGEVQLTDAMNLLANSQGLYAIESLGERYDAGDKLEYLRANIEFALSRDDLHLPLMQILEKIVNKNKSSESCKILI